MNKKVLTIIILILAIGAIFRLSITWNGNFIFNMDNARDMVDVREMVLLKQLRLTGPTSGIEGLYNGPAWYYLLALTFIISNGNPYAAIILEIILWIFGGFYLLKVIERFGKWAIIISGSLWVSSNYVLLATQYALNPNPVILLSPVFIYYLEQYLINNKLKDNIICWLLAGLFFQFEMAIGVFIPIVILITLIIFNKERFKDVKFWFGPLIFFTTLLPQLIFDLRHNLLMTKSLIGFIFETGQKSGGINYWTRLWLVLATYRQVMMATFMNNQIIVWIGLISIITMIINQRKYIVLRKNILTVILFLLIVIPLLGHILIPINVMPWHLGIPAASIILLMTIAVSSYMKNKIIEKVVIIISLFLVIVCINNLMSYWQNRYNQDPSRYINEITAINYVYQQAKGKNFKVYVYLPSVIDYPYQYLFWWYGYQQYGYLPLDYAYLPDQPVYIRNKELLQRGSKPVYEGKVFLIKEPNRLDLQDLWNNSFTKLKKISNTMIGRLEIAILQE